MSEQPPDRPGREPEELTPEQRRLRRERLARVFGESLPEQTGDDRDPAVPEDDGAAQDRWWREQRPPHHGG